ncbi:unnamed protein product [Spirodela intermedia]|uniref:Uncharacterized protein n=1 Tax=Spirodela intermedia TaxID=51605 RepID=A0ABN7ECA8_SPIIN|nr:unnamed protein product [Spirodela intermedia]
MASGLDSRPTSKESNDGQTGSDIGWRWCLLFVGEWGEARSVPGCILFAFSNFYNMQTNTVAEAMAIRDGLLLSSLEAQEYLGRHHAMSRTHHNYYASIPRRESDKLSAYVGIGPLLNYRSIAHQTCQTSCESAT